MRLKAQLILGAALVAAVAFAPVPVAAQAFTPPRGLGSVTLAWQYVSNTGHRFTDGTFMATGQSVTTSVLLEVDYAISDRFDATIGLPYVFAKYTGPNEPISKLPVDLCRCWHSSFQDVAVTARYRFGNSSWAVTPVVRYGRPTYDYPYRGEAVVGRDLQEVQVGVLSGLRLPSFLSKATVQVGYTYAFVERPLDDVPIDRSNGFIDIGYALNRRLYLRTGANLQKTHGGLRIGSTTGNPFPRPGEVNTPERGLEADRVLRVNYRQLGGGISYSVGRTDIFASFTKYVWGQDAHNGHFFGLGATWYFDRSK